jgi:short-subunit dehydrogenase
MKTPSRTALITGASAGIGASFARQLAAQGYTLLLVARRADRLQALAQELTAAHGIRCEVFTADLADTAAPRAVMAYAHQQGLTVDLLINNAGLSGHKKFVDTPWAELAGEIQVMITAVTELAHLVAPGMIERKWGRIINVSSLAAFAPPGESLLYSAIKTYVLIMSESLDMELKPHGIHVTALCPGFTKSEFHDVMGTRSTANKLPAFLWQQADEVAKEAIEAVMRGKPVCVPGTFNKFSVALMRPLPEWARYRIGKRANPFK